MADVNEIRIKGNVGSVDELRYVGQNQLALLKFSVATSKIKGKPKQGETPEFETTWHNVTVWGEQALALVNTGYLKKGTRVSVVGRQEHTEFDKKDGKKGYSSQIVAGSDIEILLNVKKLNKAAAAPPPPPPPPPVQEPDDDEDDSDLPF